MWSKKYFLDIGRKRALEESFLEIIDEMRDAQRFDSGNLVLARVLKKYAVSRDPVAAGTKETLMFHPIESGGPQIHGRITEVRKFRLVTDDPYGNPSGAAFPQKILNPFHRLGFAHSRPVRMGLQAAPLRQ